MEKIKVGLNNQSKEYLQKILKALNEVRPQDKNNPFYDIYKTEVIEALKSK